MSVDISPNLPPISSWTTLAPSGSGADGGGSSVCQRSMRRIMWDLRLFGRVPRLTGRTRTPGEPEPPMWLVRPRTDVRVLAHPPAYGGARAHHRPERAPTRRQRARLHDPGDLLRRRPGDRS